MPFQAFSLLGCGSCFVYKRTLLQIVRNHERTPYDAALQNEAMIVLPIWIAFIASSIGLYFKGNMPSALLGCLIAVRVLFIDCHCEIDKEIRAYYES